MKKFLLFLFAFATLSAVAQTSPDDQLVPLSQCFAHCATQFSYWAWIFGPLIFFAALAFVIHRQGVKTNKDVDNIIKAVCIVAFFAIMIAIFVNPCNLHQNTTVGWAKQNQWVGY